MYIYVYTYILSGTAFLRTVRDGPLLSTYCRSHGHGSAAGAGDSALAALALEAAVDLEWDWMGLPVCVCVCVCFFPDLAGSRCGS